MIEKISDFIESSPNTATIILIFIIIYKVVKWVAEQFSIFDIFKSKIYIPLAKHLKYKKFITEAIKCDIRGNVNSALSSLEDELPSGWIRKMDIQWVKKETKDELIFDNSPVVRMKPIANQDVNYVKAVGVFLTKSFFPSTKELLPKSIFKSSVLYISKRIIYKRKQSLIDCFNKTIYEPTVQKDGSILSYFSQFEKIDLRGFFTGVFIQEADNIAAKSRFSESRDNISDDIDLLLQHINEFIGLFKKKGTNTIPHSQWFRKINSLSYGFLLVADPTKEAGGERQYVNRAKKDLLQGLQRLYVFCAAKQDNFTESVINEIEKSQIGWRLENKFKLYRDYRGKNGGIGALFVKNNISIKSQKIKLEEPNSGIKDI